MGKKPAEKAKEVSKKAESAASAKKVKAKAAEAHAAGTAEAKSKKKAHAAEAKPKEKHCQIKSCKREYRAKGYCRVHYKKWRQGEYGVARYKTCKDMDCRKAMAKNRHGYCEDHFQNYYVKGMEVAKTAAPAKPEEKKADSTAAA